MQGLRHNRRLSIAQFAPLVEPVPPILYGGIERVVSNLTEELIRRGHEVVLFASADSNTSAKLIPCCPRALRLDPSAGDPMPHLFALLSMMRDQLERFDILHFHTDLVRHSMFRRLVGRAVTTVHMPATCPISGPRFEQCPHTPVVAISHNQRAMAPGMNWVGTVHHGLPVDLLRPARSPRKDYLVFLSRLERDKRPDRAIEIARRAGLPIKIAGKVGRADRAFFAQHVEPLLDQNGVKFLGEIEEAEKAELLGNARAMLFPIEWQEAFGLVLIEAMACGTPVVAFAKGSVPEIVEDGVTGFVVENIEEAVEAVHRVDRLDRATIRSRFEERFSDGTMIEKYLDIYGSLLSTPAALL